MRRSEIGPFSSIIVNICQKPFLIGGVQLEAGRISLVVRTMQKFPGPLTNGPLLAEAPLKNVMRAGRVGGLQHGDQASAV